MMWASALYLHFVAPLLTPSCLSSFCCSDRSALCGTLQEVKHWNGEQDHSFATTIG